ncbi:MAG: Diaminopimelate epimerase [uncultured Thermomicrobiales bacterium]|uniref:Diaminopimelate epimerase n=1 Tax=uncultured Thermomicrobiales bacterium TaxID=1645740 RepID=A0A6J4TQN3_9BACT|nr:MAG: Diaminopimelate epimerase [uncultured Thermomicrobiales bacterium]
MDDAWLPATPIPFWKMTGSGNDFVVVDNRSGLIPPAAVAGFARRVCRRGLALGADGVVLIGNAGPGDGADFAWRYVNADGSDGDFCGNGAICGARFAVLNRIAPARCVLATAAGPVRADVPDPADPRVRLAIADPGPLRLDLPVDLAGGPRTVHAIAVGVPHAVLPVEDLDGFGPDPAFAELGRAVRRHPAFPDGTNLDAIAVLDRSTLRMRTYERGVEAETLACGSGAVASAIVATALGRVAPPVTVVTRSGLPLAVDFAWHPATARATAVTLGGEARVVATGELWPEGL